MLCIKFYRHMVCAVKLILTIERIREFVISAQLIIYAKQNGVKYTTISATGTMAQIGWRRLLLGHGDEIEPCLVRDTISESLLDFPLKSQTPVEALWSLPSIDLRVIALHPSFVNSRMPQNASLVLLIIEPIRVNVFSFVIHKRGNSQYPEQCQ